MKKFLLILSLFTLSLQAATVSTNLNLLAVNAASNQYPANIRLFGAIPNDSLSDDVAISNAQLAKGEVRIPAGLYNVNTNITISSTNDLVFDFGGRLKPASGVTITVRGGIKAGPTQQIFDISAGGRILFVNTLGTAFTKVDRIWAGWWGPDNNNTGITGDDTKLAAWLQSTASGVATEKWIAQSFYTVNTPLTLSNKWQVYGSGMPTISGSIAANTSVFKVADGSDDVIIDGFIINAYTSGTGTNVFGINIGLDCDRGKVRNCNFTGKLYGGGIYNSGNSLYWTFRNCFATGLDNTTANGGNNLLPSAFVVSTNVFSRTTFYDCIVYNSNQGLRLHGGTATNSGNISWIGGGFEGVGHVTLATNTIQLQNISEFDFQNAHFENNTNVNMVYGTGMKQFNSIDTLFSGDFGGSIKTTNLITLDQVGTANIRGGRLSNPLVYFINNLGSTKPVYVWGGYFDNGGITNISDAAVAAKLNGSVVWNWITNVTDSGTYTPTIDILQATNIASIATIRDAQYLRVGNIVTVSGQVTLAATAAAGTDSSITISLPVASNLADAGQLTGVANSEYNSPMTGAIIADATLDKALLLFDANTTSARIFSYMFNYQVQ